MSTDVPENEPQNGKDIIISGMSATLPASADIYQFRENLFSKFDMVCGTYEDWQNHPYMPKTTGMIPFIDKFDRGYFGVTNQQSSSMEPTLRIMLEKSVEAIHDAGYHPSDFQNTKVGVFSAANFPETERVVYYDTTKPSSDPIIGSGRSMLSNYISYCLKLIGPSFEVDSACSSSLSALEHACQAIKDGKCQKALVLSGNLCLFPHTTIGYVKIGILSLSGKNKSFDESADGCTRAEGIVAFVIEKRKDAKRIYAELVHVKCSSEGFKIEGILHPSIEGQKKHLESFYKECNIDPLHVSYIEAHGTGTKVGDYQELRGLDEVFCKNRRGPLYIGSVKSNCGHTEGASGACGIIKLILAMETGLIPPNLHCHAPRNDIEALKSRRMSVVTENISLPDDNVLLCVNNFGFGGSTGHVLLHWNKKAKINCTGSTDNLPRLVCVSGRNRDALDAILKEYSKQHDPEYAYLLHHAFKKPDQIYRAYGIYNRFSEIKRCTRTVNFREENGLVLLFNDYDQNCLKFGSSLMEISIFAETMRSIQNILNNISIVNLSELFKNPTVTKPIEVILGTVAVQIGLANVLKGIKLTPNYIEGLGYGKEVADYMKGSRTLEETILAVHFAIFKRTDNTTGHQDGDGFIDCNGKDFSDNWLKFNQKSIHLIVSDTDSKISSHTLTLLPKNSDSCVLDLLDTLGRLYQHGFQMEIDKLYPPIDLPVSRGTGMISPFVNWNHTKNCKVYRTLNQMEVNHECRQVTITPKEEEWAYITGYVLDGENILPPTVYLVMAWDTLARILDKSMIDMKVVFEDVHFIRSTTVAEDSFLKLSVSLQLGMNVFEITESGSMLATGKIYEKQDQQVLTALPTLSIDEGQLLMNGEDIYRLLRLRGYYYRGGFKGIEKSTVDLSKVFVQWKENWVEYLDYLLQLTVLWDDSKELLLVNNIQSLVIDAPRHSSSAKAFNSTAPIYSYKELDTIRADGIEIRGVRHTAAVRRKQVDPLLETTIFVPNKTHMDLPNSIRIFVQIILENINGTRLNIVEVCSEMQDESQLLCFLIQSAVADTPLTQEDVTVLTKKQIQLPGVTVKNTPLRDQTNCTVLIVTNLLETIEISTALNTIQAVNGFVISKESLDTNLSKFLESPFKILCNHNTYKEILLLLRPITQISIPRHYLDVTDAADTFKWLPKLQDLLKQHEEVVIYVQNDVITGVLGLMTCLKAEFGTGRIRCFLMMDKAVKFDPKLLFYRNQLEKNMLVNIWSGGTWGTYRYLPLPESNLIQDDNCCIGVTDKGDFNWMQGFEQDALAPGEYIVHVYYSSINFKNSVVAGRKNPGISKGSLQCLDFAGRNIKGDRVMGLCTEGPIRTSIKSNLILPIPDEWTMEEAASTVLPYTIAFAILLKDSRPIPGQTILIHSATCEVGLAAINLSLHFGLTIFATADTSSKREFLKKHYPQLKSQYIGNSTDNSFEEIVFKHTCGRGVNYVISPLVGEAKLASARCLAKGGTFFEIVASEMASASGFSLHLLEKEAEFRTLTLDKGFLKDNFCKDNIVKLIEYGAIKPLPRIVFQYDDLEAAVRLANEDKEVGKVLVNIRPEENGEICEILKNSFTATPRFYCDPKCSYIIYGGLGGFGFELGDFLVTKGAKKLIITSRSGSVSGYQRYKIRNWVKYNVSVQISTFNACNQQNCLELLKMANELGPVDAIFNVAAECHDGLFENQNEHTFRVALDPKAACTRNLDECSGKLCPSLRYFVVFSSISGGRGVLGQTNYGLANSVVDRICEKRRREGYPGLAIQWGPVEEVGMFARMQDTTQGVWGYGVIPQKVASCLDVLGHLSTQKEAVIASTLIDRKKSSDKSSNLFRSVLNMLGVGNLKSISMQGTVSDLGADSLILVEIRQFLDREHGIFMGSKELRSMTLASLRSLSDSKESRGP